MPRRLVDAVPPPPRLGRSLLVLLAVCAMVLVGLALPAPSASAATTSDKGIQYSYSATSLSKGATATGYKGKATSLTIPNSIKVKGSRVKVVSIAKGAFQGGKIKSATIGNNVTFNGASAFGSNPLMFVTLTGPAPRVTPAGATGSFDASATVLVRYQQLYQKSWMYPKGFTYPKWQGYQTYSPRTSWCVPKKFDDVSSGNGFCDDIGWTALQGIADGYSDGGFHPGASISRQAIAAQLYRLTHPGSGDASCRPGRTFNDVGSSNKFCGDIEWMAARKITRGYSDGGFHPTAPVTRQAMAAFLHSANSLSR